MPTLPPVLRLNRVPVGERAYPRDLPERWWTLPTAVLAPLLNRTVWPSALPLSQAGLAMEALLLFHPSLVPQAMAQGLRPRAWFRRFDDTGERLPRQHLNRPETSLMRLVLTHGDAAALNQALAHRMPFTSAEHGAMPLLGPHLPLALLLISRHPPVGSRVSRLTPQDRREREAQMLQVLVAHGHPELGGASEPRTIEVAAVSVTSDAALAALTEHGIDPRNGWPAHHPTVVLANLVRHQTPEQLDRVLR